MVKSLILIFTSISLAVVGQLFLKRGMTSVGRLNNLDPSNLFAIMKAAFGNPQVLTGLLLYIISALFWLIVLSRVDLSFAYPMLGFSYVLVLFASSWLFNEDITPLRWLGALVISFGVFLITRT